MTNRPVMCPVPFPSRPPGQCGVNQPLPPWNRAYPALHGLGVLHVFNGILSSHCSGCPISRFVIQTEFQPALNPPVVREWLLFFMLITMVPRAAPLSGIFPTILTFSGRDCRADNRIL